MKAPFVLALATLAGTVHPAESLGQWQPGGVLAGPSGYYSGSTSDGNGGVILAWTGWDSEAGEFRVYAQKINASGVAAWGAGGVDLGRGSGSLTEPVLAPDGQGGAFVAWSDDRDPNEDNRDVYARRVDAAGNPVGAANGELICTAPGSQFDLDIVADGNGGALIAWADARQGGTGTYNDIYAQKVSSSVVPQWASPKIVCRAPHHQTHPLLVMDGAGGAIVFWSDNRTQVASRIYARRITAEGDTLWAANGVLVSRSDTAALQTYSVQTASDGAGGAYIAWQESDATTYPYVVTIYLARLDAQGATPWGAAGIRVCEVAGAQRWPSVAPVPGEYGGGVIVAWTDDRSGYGNSDLFAQRFHPDGSKAWASDGVALCDAAGNQDEAQVASDDLGGVIAVWTDNRSGGDLQLFAQRLSWGGKPIWADDGTPVGQINGNLWQMPSLITSAPGIAIATWYGAGVGTGVYASILPFNATSVGVTPGLSLLEVRDNYPNPFSGSTKIEVRAEGHGSVAVNVFDVTGRLVRAHSLGQSASGWRTLRFDAHDDAGRALPAGVYFYRVSTNGSSVTKKMVIVQ